MTETLNEGKRCNFEIDVNEEIFYFCSCRIKSLDPICDDCMKDHKKMGHTQILRLDNDYIKSENVKCVCGMKKHVIPDNVLPERECIFESLSRELPGEFALKDGLCAFCYENKELDSSEKLDFEYSSRLTIELPPNEYRCFSGPDLIPGKCACVVHSCVGQNDLELFHYLILYNLKSRIRIPNVNVSIFAKNPILKQLLFDNFNSILSQRNLDHKNKKNLLLILEIFDKLCTKISVKDFYIHRFITIPLKDLIEILRNIKPTEKDNEQEIEKCFKIKVLLYNFLYFYFIKYHLFQNSNFFKLETIVQMNIYQRNHFIHKTKEFKNADKNFSNDYSKQDFEELCDVAFEINSELTKNLSDYPELLSKLNKSMGFLIKYNLVKEESKKKYFENFKLNILSIEKSQNNESVCRFSYKTAKSILYYMLHYNDQIVLNRLKNSSEEKSKEIETSFIFEQSEESKLISYCLVLTIMSIVKGKSLPKKIFNDLFFIKFDLVIDNNLNILLGNNFYYKNNIKNLAFIPEFSKKFYLDSSKCDKSFSEYVFNFVTKLSQINCSYIYFELKYDIYLGKLNNLLDEIRNNSEFAFFKEINFNEENDELFIENFSELTKKNDSRRFFENLQNTYISLNLNQKIEEILIIFDHLDSKKINNSPLSEENYEFLMKLFVCLVWENPQNITLIHNFQAFKFERNFSSKKGFFNVIKTLSIYYFNNNYIFNNYLFFSLVSIKLVDKQKIGYVDKDIINITKVLKMMFNSVDKISIFRPYLQDNLQLLMSKVKFFMDACCKNAESIIIGGNDKENKDENFENPLQTISTQDFVNFYRAVFRLGNEILKSNTILLNIFDYSSLGFKELSDILKIKDFELKYEVLRYYFSKNYQVTLWLMNNLKVEGTFENGIYENFKLLGIDEKKNILNLFTRTDSEFIQEKIFKFSTDLGTVLQHFIDIEVSLQKNEKLDFFFNCILMNTYSLFNITDKVVMDIPPFLFIMVFDFLKKLVSQDIINEIFSNNENEKSLKQIQEIIKIDFYEYDTIVSNLSPLWTMITEKNKSFMNDDKKSEISKNVNEVLTDYKSKLKEVISNSSSGLIKSLEYSKSLEFEFDLGTVLFNYLQNKIFDVSSSTETQLQGSAENRNFDKMGSGVNIKKKRTIIIQNEKKAILYRGEELVLKYADSVTYIDNLMRLDCKKLQVLIYEDKIRKEKELENERESTNKNNGDEVKLVASELFDHKLNDNHTLKEFFSFLINQFIFKGVLYQVANTYNLTEFKYYNKIILSSFKILQNFCEGHNRYFQEIIYELNLDVIDEKYKKQVQSGLTFTEQSELEDNVNDNDSNQNPETIEKADNNDEEDEVKEKEYFYEDDSDKSQSQVIVLLTSILRIIYNNKERKLRVKHDDVNEGFQYCIDLLVEMAQGTEGNIKHFFNLKSKDVGLFHDFREHLNKLNSIKYCEEDKQIEIELQTKMFNLVNNILLNLPKNEEDSGIDFISGLVKELDPEYIIELISLFMKKIYIRYVDKSLKTLEFHFDQEKLNMLSNEYKENPLIIEDYEYKLATEMYLLIRILCDKYEKTATEAVRMIEFSNKRFSTLGKNDKKNDKKSNEKKNKVAPLNDDKQEPTVKVSNRKEHKLDDIIATAKFFSEFVKEIEFNIGGEIKKIYIVKNYYVFNISEEMINNFQDNVLRENPASKLGGMIKSIDKFEAEVKYIEEIGKRSIKKMLYETNYNYADLINFIFALILNLLLLYYLNLEQLQTGEIFFKLTLICYVQLIMNFFYLMVFIYSKYDFYVKYNESKSKYKENYTLYKKIHLRVFKCFLLNLDIRLILINSIFASVIIMRPTWIYLCILQLFTIYKFVSTIKDLILAFKLGMTQLLSMIVFLVILMLIYANIGFYFFSNNFVQTTDDGTEENICQSLLQCFITYFDIGVKSSGGIFDIMKPAGFENMQYFIARLFNDMIYYIIVAILLIYMINGIIIGAFSELREAHNLKMDDTKNKCFICSINKFEFEKRKLNFESHKEKEHNIRDYIDYLVLLKNIDEKDMDADQSVVYEKFKNKDINIFPVNRCLTFDLTSEEKDE